jgi:hypothetical protein
MVTETSGEQSRMFPSWYNNMEICVGSPHGVHNWIEIFYCFFVHSNLYVV